MKKAYITTQIAPASFEYYPEVMTCSEAEFLVDRLLQLPLVSHVMRGQQTKRKMHHFGWSYGPQQRTLSPVPDPIPD